jgi:hypothetical protein
MNNNFNAESWETTKTLTYWDKSGNVTDDERKSIMKKVSTTCDDRLSVQHYIMFGRGELVDPYGVDSNLSYIKIQQMYKFKKVTKEAFDFYTRYLKSKNRSHFTNARRLTMENN